MAVHPLVPRALVATAAALVTIGTWALVGPAEGAGAAPGSLAGVDLACQGAADGSDRVAVVVAFSASDVQRRCVAAGGSGIDVLRRAGFAPVTSDYQGVGGAAAVCAVTNPRTGEQMGCDTGPSCLVCADPSYWSYYRGNARGYTYQGVGGGSTTPQQGLVEAWQWGTSASWQHARVGPSAICTPPETTTTTTAPPPTRPPGDPGEGGGGPGGPRGGGGSSGGAGPSPTDGPDAGSPTTPDGTPEPDGREPTTTSGSAPAGADDPFAPDGAVGDAVDGPAPAGSDGGEEATGSPPGGTVSVRDADDGGRRALVPVVATGSAVAAFAALAIRARRRRTGADPPAP